VIAGVGGSRITIAGGNFDGTTPLNAGGSQNHTLVAAEIPAHTHTITDPGHNHLQNAHTHPNNAVTSNTAFAGLTSGANGVNAVTYTSVGNTTAVNISNTTGITGTNVNTGGGGSHTVLQPTMVTTIIIKL